MSYRCNIPFVNRHFHRALFIQNRELFIQNRDWFIQRLAYEAAKRIVARHSIIELFARRSRNSRRPRKIPRRRIDWRSKRNCRICHKTLPNRFIWRIIAGEIAVTSFTDTSTSFIISIMLLSVDERVKVKRSFAADACLANSSNFQLPTQVLAVIKLRTFMQLYMFINTIRGTLAVYIRIGF